MPPAQRRASTCRPITSEVAGVLRLFARGLVTGLASIALTVAVVFGLGWLASQQPCDGLGCLSGLGVAVLLVAGSPMLLAVIGPLVAWLLRFRPPACFVFAAPPGWLGVWVCLGFQGFQSGSWLLYSLGATAVMLLISYGLSAWLASAIELSRRSGSSHRR